MSVVGLSSLSPTPATAWSPAVTPAPSAATPLVTAPPTPITVNPTTPSHSVAATPSVNGSSQFLHITQLALDGAGAHAHLVKLFGGGVDGFFGGLHHIAKLGELGFDHT